MVSILPIYGIQRLIFSDYKRSLLERLDLVFCDSTVYENTQYYCCGFSWLQFFEKATHKYIYITLQGHIMALDGPAPFCPVLGQPLFSLSNIPLIGHCYLQLYIQYISFILSPN